ncbi:MAG: NADH-quinone oxidoreductase subunit G [Sulfurospirillum sp.]|nr:NADH-quinone oxidoreductase subunit G [Sulfurospirillum sp.]
MKKILITIDGVECRAKEGEFILNIARENSIFIPALCYISNCSPTLACRLCLVEVDGKRAYSCNAKAKDGMSVTTKNEEIEKERRAIMEIYDINHPLECGVCDQSGECELQNYTLEIGVNSQNHAIADMPRPTAHWGKINYDPSLCIVCERCVTVCKDMIGESALKTVKREGVELDKEWKEKTPKDAYAMWNKLQKSIIGVASGADNLDCTMCGECSSVCPVGALVSSDFQYKSNAWELKKIPAANPHSSDCSFIYYDVRHNSISDSNNKIFRVSNDYSFAPIHGGIRYGYDFENIVDSKDEEKFDKVVEIIKTKVDTIVFDSFITNEEALILQKLKDKYKYKLINNDAYMYKRFLNNFASTSGVNLYNGDLQTIQKSNFVISIGTALKTDSPNSGYMLNNALTMNKGAGLYFHPIADPVINGYSKNLLSINHKVGAEEAVLYLILDLFGKNLPDKIANYIESFHTKYSKSTDKDTKLDINSLYEILGVEDFSETLEKLLLKKDNFSLIAGEDLYNHPKSKNLAKILGLIQKYTDFNVVIIPSQTNTLGVSLICDLDEKKGKFSLGYNIKADVTLSALGKGDLDMPALNQQEGTFTSMNKRVVPTNAALSYHGYCLNDIANELGFDAEFTIDYTVDLPISSGFQEKEFDSLSNEFTQSGEEKRGYMLNSKPAICKDEIDELSEFEEIKNPLYLANPVKQFNAFTNKSHQLNEIGALYASSEFLEKNEFKNGDMVVLEGKNGVKLVLKIELDSFINGNIPYLPTFDNKLNTKQFFAGGYRFAEVSIKGVK